MHRRAIFRTRRGYVLAYFAMMSFALMALAALVIDVGFAIVARRQMKAAADSAALEGLRFRDAIPPPVWQPDAEADCGPPPAPDDPSYPTWAECARRWAARQVVLNSFDDDLAPGNGDRLNLGAGPVVGFQDSPNLPAGDQAIAASQELTLGQPAVYDPYDVEHAFELNKTNEPTGDMVAGTYTGSTSVLDPSASQSAGAFLVRMRRTNDTPEAGVSSTGPPIPYLFGRGSLLTTQSKGAGTVWAKSQGIAVRATAIADARPALTAGRPMLPGEGFGGMPGVAPFGLSVSFWGQFAPATDPVPPGTKLTTVTLKPDPARPGGLISEVQSVGRDGHYLSWPAGRTPTIGWLVSPLTPTPTPSIEASTYQYVPIFGTVAGDEWVVGFGVADVAPAASSSISVTIRSSMVAQANASGVPSGGFDPTLTSAETLQAILQMNQSMGVSPPGTGLVLRAPVLVRSE